MSTALTESYWPADSSSDVIDVTLGDLLRQGAAEVPDRLALVDGSAPFAERRRWTYAELLHDSERLARTLLERFAPGERVAAYAPNCPEWVLLHHAVSLAGLQLVPLNPAYKGVEAHVMLRNAQVSGVFYAEQYRGNDIGAILRELGPHLEHLRETIPLDTLEALPSSQAPPSGPLPPVAPGDVLHVQFTSGTTGTPKGALLHHRGLINSARFIAERAEFPDGGVWINAMPMYHSGGAATSRIGCLSRQGTFVLAPGFEAGQMLELIETERGNTTLIVPTMILAMLGHETFPSRDLSSLLTVLSGATNVPAALVHRAKSAMGCRFAILFGQTEVSGVVTGTQAGGQHHRPSGDGGAAAAEC